MKGNEIFRQCYSRLAKEGWLKALISGVIVGFAANFITAFALWCAGVEQLWWIAICVGVAFIAISAPVFYVWLFRPTAKKIAERVDGLGLEERLITMLELENDESYIAMRQREDAKEHLRRVDKKSIRFNFSKVAIASAVVVALVGVGMTTYSALSYSGIVPPAEEVGGGIEDIVTSEEEVFYEVVYMVDGGGMIDGEEIQIVLKGESTQPVTAVADDGWMFDSWLEDGYTEAVRTDTNIQANVTYTAVFVEVEMSDGEGEGEGEGEGDQGEGSAPSDAPGSEGQGEGQQGENGQGGSGESNNGFGDGQGDGAGGGANDENDKVLDGKTDYKDVYQQYLDLYNEYTQRGEEVPEEILEFLENFYGIL